MDMADRGHEVHIVDNYLRRQMAKATHSESLFNTPKMQPRCERFEQLVGPKINSFYFDCTDFERLGQLVAEIRPETIIHYAEQPSAPYSMAGFDQARLTLHNNLNSTFNVIWACIQFAPDCHIIKLGTMGEYGTPNIDIEEGWLDVIHKGRREKFLYPRQAGSLYHTTKILDTDLLWFYVRTHELRVTDLMQGPVYGISTALCDLHEDLAPNFHYDDIFGTVINRFLVQAVADIPLTIFGKGGQTRGYLNLVDTLQCVNLAAENPASAGELRVLNQFTETFSVNDIAERIQQAGRCLNLNVNLQHIPNPRKELEDHYYNPASSGLQELGLVPHLMTDEVLVEMLDRIMKKKKYIDHSKIMPRVRWSC